MCRMKLLRSPTSRVGFPISPRAAPVRGSPYFSLAFCVGAVLIYPAAGYCQLTATATQSVTGTISAIGDLSVPASLTLTTTGGPTTPPYTGSLTVSYRARTTSSGSGTVTLQVTTNFSPAGGPSAASGSLTYTCSGADLGTNCSGPITAATGAATGVVTIPASACTGGGASCSANNPNTMQVSFSLTDSMTYKTGTFSAVVTFVISAT